MLDKELDKLRDKTLSFGCRVIDKTHSFFWKSVPEEMIIVSKNMEFYETDWVYLLHYRWNPTVNFPIEDILDGEKCEIIWNPLTRWRIYSLRFKVNKQSILIDVWNTVDNIWCLLSIMDMFDKTEIERMKSPHREELKKLLIQFSNYL